MTGPVPTPVLRERERAYRALALGAVLGALLALAARERR